MSGEGQPTSRISPHSEKGGVVGRTARQPDCGPVRVGQPDATKRTLVVVNGTFNGERAELALFVHERENASAGSWPGMAPLPGQTTRK